MEAVYDDIPSPIGFLRFAPEVVAKGSMFGARKRAGRPGESAVPVPVEEGSLDDGSPGK
jgi:hypothetical protein